mmetsp:Transcript_97715/g.157609  ORF Transcript_97715/g.157609 Transcript_97715/m.157609 type:complete len:217 (+) Transcript_97715:618-1268(+)
MNCISAQAAIFPRQNTVILSPSSRVMIDPAKLCKAHWQEHGAIPAARSRVQVIAAMHSHTELSWCRNSGACAKSSSCWACCLPKHLPSCFDQYNPASSKRSRNRVKKLRAAHSSFLEENSVHTGCIVDAVGTSTCSTTAHDFIFDWIDSASRQFRTRALPAWGCLDSMELTISASDSSSALDAGAGSSAPTFTGLNKHKYVSNFRRNVGLSCNFSM